VTPSQDLLGLVFFTLMVTANFVGMIVTAHLVGRLASRRGAPAKDEPFECGMPVDAPPPTRMPVSFYVAGLLLLIFDVETVFLYPWAVEFRALGWFGFVEMLVFLGLLGTGYVYIWRRGAFRW
jgi:NADH-quinone oxidoreductase subunit A